MERIMPVTELPIFTYYNRQRFPQFGCMDNANWYGIAEKDTKKGQALYPAMGRAHVNFFDLNKLVFDTEPSQIFKTINYMYVIVGTTVIQVDRFYNEKVIGNVPLGSVNWFAFLPVGNLVYGILTAGTLIYLITENFTANTVTMVPVTDVNAPKMPLYVAAFGNRFVVSNSGTPDYFLTNLAVDGGPGGMFTSASGAPIQNRATGVIGQMCVLHNQLYILCDFTTDIWSNIPSQNVLNTDTTPFPWKLNSSYNWDYGIADPFSLDVDFGIMAWLGKNSSGLVTFMASNGQQPEPISTQAINVILQNSDSPGNESSFIKDSEDVDGFLYQYENSIFYRVSAGPYIDYQQLDIDNVDNPSSALEYNFSTQTWGRVIELNGQRNRIQKHVFFNNTHLVTVLDDPAIYVMAGNLYYNETRNIDFPPNDPKAFNKYPMRYELVTQQIYQEDYSEFITDYIEIDFVFGLGFFKNDTVFDNGIFIITEDADAMGNPIYVITEDAAPDGVSPVFVIVEDGNTPAFDDNFYNALFKPAIGLYYSDDGGITFTYAGGLEFAQKGQYRYRMRWYELANSRNRCYKLICVSSTPIVILGAVQNIRRSSGGAN